MTKKDLQYRETKTIPIRVLPIIQMTWIASRKRGDWNDSDNAAPESWKAATSKKCASVGNPVEGERDSAEAEHDSVVIPNSIPV